MTLTVAHLNLWRPFKTLNEHSSFSRIERKSCEMWNAIIQNTQAALQVHLKTVNSGVRTWCSYLIWQLWIVILGSSEDKDGAERGHMLQQGKEGAFHSVTHCLPPLWDMWHEHHTGCAAAGLAENL